MLPQQRDARAQKRVGLREALVVERHAAAHEVQLQLALDVAGLAPAVTLVEVHDDGLPRQLTALLGGAVVSVDPAPLSATPPTAVLLYADGADVDEDWRAPLGSPASGAGLAAPGELAPDVGALTAPAGPFPGGLPADHDDPLQLLAVSPFVDTPLAAGQLLRLRFDTPPDPARVGPHSVQVLDGALQDVGAVAAVVDGLLEVGPALGGWPAGPLLVVLHPSLSAPGGEAPAASVILPFQVTP